MLTDTIEKHLNGSWPARTLAAATVSDNGRVHANSLRGAVLMSMLAHRFDNEDEFLILMHCVWPYNTGVTGPIICSIGRIDKRGAIIADMLVDGVIYSRTEIARNSKKFEGHMRKFCDEMKFNDYERVDFFAMVHLWLASDERLDPSMDRNDPDAKRLVLH